MSGYRSHSQRVGRETFDVDVRYTNFEPIGDGAYGFVCSADDNATGQRVAIKKVKDMFRDLGDAKRILRELKLLRHFRPHENVVTILDIMVYPENSLDFRDVYIVTNLMEIDLQRIISSKQPLTNQHYHYFLYQLLRGLKYIHSANVLHRDLKPSNLVLNANCDLAICDFGLARGVDQEGSETLTEYVQTRWYRAPELLCYSSTYDAAVDMWSVGCVFAELLGGRPFFQGKNPMHQLQVIVDVLGCPSEEDMMFIKDKAARAVILKQARHTGVPRGTGGPRPLAEYFPDNTSPHAIDLLSKMLVFNPEMRIRVEEALEHPYVGDLHAEMLGREPVCHSVFDFDFEKKDALAGVRTSVSTPRRHRVIPSGELKALVLEELMAYRPSFEGSTLLFRARQAAVEQRHLQLQAAVGSPSTADNMEPQDYEAFLRSAQVALGTLSPMVDAAMGPGMTTPTPGVHGYPGAMPYSSAVPPRGASHSQYVQQQQQQQQQRRSSNSRQRGLPPQHPPTHARQGLHQSQHAPGSSSARRAASPAAVAAAVAAATAASSAASQAQNGGFPGMGGHGAGGASGSHRASMYPGFYVEQAFADGTLGLQQQQQQCYPQGSWGQTQPGAMETDQQHI